MKLRASSCVKEYYSKYDNTCHSMTKYDAGLHACLWNSWGRGSRARALHANYLMNSDTLFVPRVIMYREEGS